MSIRPMLPICRLRHRLWLMHRHKRQPHSHHRQLLRPPSPLPSQHRGHRPLTITKTIILSEGPHILCRQHKLIHAPLYSLSDVPPMRFPSYPHPRSTRAALLATPMPIQRVMRPAAAPTTLITSLITCLCNVRHFNHRPHQQVQVEI